ncbi:hypothetical protein Chor_004605, partial [Crotalus horridus]
CITSYPKRARSVPEDIRNCTINPPYLPPTVIVTDQRLKTLREHMKSHKLSAYIVPNTDAHLSEYVAERDKRLRWMTGFSGSEGTGVITLQKAVLFTDSRYWIQAERQMDCNWELQKSVWINSIGQWILKEVPAGETIGLDPFLFSVDTWLNYHQVLEGTNRTLDFLEVNLVDLVWGSERLPPPTNTIYRLADDFMGLFNLRGDDIPYTPVFYAYTLLTKTDISRLSKEALQMLTAGCPESPCVKVEDYDQIGASLRKYVRQDGVIIWIGTEYTTLGLYKEIPQIRDAVALIRYLVWLEKNVPKNTVDEVSGANYLDSLRREELHCKGPSFETISASGLNAALAHYSPSNLTSRKLSLNEMYLLDSGGQYFDGTTDITRTIHWGEPTAFQKEAYTRVLMGNIDLSKLVFPPRMSGRLVESFARRPLWEAGLNYGHGTGHGIGNFLSVHECKWQPGQTAGLWLFGDSRSGGEPPPYSVQEDPYLTFKVVSLVPYARNLINESLLSQDQIQYINKYYETIRQIIGPELQRRQLEEEYRWLEKNTEPFSHASVLAASLGTLAVSTLASGLLPAAQH